MRTSMRVMYAVAMKLTATYRFHMINEHVCSEEESGWFDTLTPMPAISELDCIGGGDEQFTEP